MAEIERIAQELRAANKRPLPATEDQVKELVKLAERDRPLTVKVNSAVVAKQLVGQVEGHVQVFQTTGYQLINYLDERLKDMTGVLDQRLAAIKAAETSLQAAAQRIPQQVKVDWRGNWQVMALVAGVPVLLVLLMLWFTGMFSRVPKAELAAVQAENADIRNKNAQLVNMARFYRNQVQAYRKKFPKAVSYFPKYTVPAAAPATD
jgi:hypothetical protein